MASKFQLEFNTALQSKTRTIVINYADETLDGNDVANVMDIVITQNAFTSSGGDLTSKKSARRVTTTDLVI